MTLATQDFVPIESIRDGIITLKDGSFRVVLMTSSINLALKSTDEQQAIIMQFQNMLNSLEYPLQISIQSRRLNIQPYLATLASRSKEVQEELLKVQIDEYIQFITAFTNETNIMTKHFFITVPYYSSSLSSPSSLTSSLFPFGKTTSESKNKKDTATFEEARIQLEERANTVIQGLTRSGVRAVKLSTEEVIELFYKLFNPGEEESPVPQIGNQGNNAMNKETTH